ADAVCGGGGGRAATAAAAAAATAAAAAVQRRRAGGEARAQRRRLHYLHLAVAVFREDGGWCGWHGGRSAARPHLVEQLRMTHAAAVGRAPWRVASVELVARGAQPRVPLVVVGRIVVKVRLEATVEARRRLGRRRRSGVEEVGRVAGRDEPRRELRVRAAAAVVRAAAEFRLLVCGAGRLLVCGRGARRLLVCGAAA
ncbi:MAG: hypothetical protein QGF33_13790, partial [Alphaproteobacteria bacterium]|nr:hypothetical protein [Alphaproteobacteria bacterium]